MAENRHEKFRRLAPTRVDAAVKKINAISKLATLEYSQEEAGQILTALDTAVGELGKRLEQARGPMQTMFTWTDSKIAVAAE